MRRIVVLKSEVLAIAILLTSVYSCNFSQSVNKNLITGLVTRGNGLSCDRVYLSSDEEVVERNSFIYGETFFVNFDGIEGFNRMDSNAFPGMQLVVVSQHGDTVLYHKDLYAAYTEGIEFSPLKLNSEVTVADPIHSTGEYSLFVTIWDKKGEGTFRANLDFSVVPNEKIAINSDQISYNEIYLFSQQKGETIIKNQVGFDETVYMLFEGLEGFVVESETVNIGLSIVIQDADGNLILNEADLIGDGGMSYQEIHARLAPNFILTGSEISNPVTCEITIWDKRGTARINATTQLHVE